MDLNWFFVLGFIYFWPGIGSAHILSYTAQQQPSPNKTEQNKREHEICIVLAEGMGSVTRRETFCKFFDCNLPHGQQRSLKFSIYILHDILHDRRELLHKHMLV